MQTIATAWDVQDRTRGGVDVFMRRLRPQDREALAAFFDNLSREDLRHRFLASVKALDAERLSLMFDASRATTFLSCALSDGAILAVATLAGDPGVQRVEVAVTVRSDLKGKGLAWTLMEHVLAYARATGVEVVESVETADNHAALTLEREMGFSVRAVSDDCGLRLAERAVGTPTL